MVKQLIYHENQTNYLKIKTTTLIVKTHNNFIIMVGNILYKKPPISVGLMAISLFAVSNGYLDDVPLKKIGEFEQELHNYVEVDYRDFLDDLNIKKDFNDEVSNKIIEIILNFKKLKWVV